MEEKDKLTITAEDEKVVKERLHEFSVNTKPKEAGVIRLTPSMLTNQSSNEADQPDQDESSNEADQPDLSNEFLEEENQINEDIKILSNKEKITENSLSPNYNIVFYTYSLKKKTFDFVAGFITVFAMYCFLNFQPLIIFLIFLIGAMEAVLAFKSNRMYIVWGFIWGSAFSSFIALFLSLALIYFPTNPFVIKIFSILGK
ncbi:MAG: hypothetical protein WCX30_00050 [Candidatus Paceibacterota bacterium]